MPARLIAINPVINEVSLSSFGELWPAQMKVKVITEIEQSRSGVRLSDALVSVKITIISLWQL